MISTFTMEAGLVIAALMAVVGVVQWKRQSGRQQQEKYILDYAGQVSELESQKREEERQQRQEEEKKQKDRFMAVIRAIRPDFVKIVDIDDYAWFRLWWLCSDLSRWKNPQG